MSAGTTIPIDLTPFSTLKTELAAAKKQTQAFYKELEKLKRDGKAISEDLQRNIAASEQKVSALSAKMKTQGARLRYEEQFNNRAQENLANYNVRGILQDKTEAYINALARRPGAVNSLLKNETLNKFTGNAGNELIDVGLGRGAMALGETVAAYAGPAALAYGTAKFLQEGMSIFHGYSDSFRRQQQDFNVRMSDSRFIDPVARDLEQKKFMLEQHKMDALGRASDSWLGTLATLGTANLFNAIRNRRAGIDAYSTAAEERLQAARSSGFGGVDLDKLTNMSELRAYADQYGSGAAGFIMQNTWGKVKALFGSNADAEEVTKRVKESLKRFEAFAKSGDEAAIRGDFAAAEANYAAAGKEAGMKEGWRNPLQIWTANDQATKGAVGYALSQNPLPPLRRGQ